MAVARKLKATLLGPFAAEALCMSQVPAIRGNLARLGRIWGALWLLWALFGQESWL